MVSGTYSMTKFKYLYILVRNQNETQGRINVQLIFFVIAEEAMLQMDDVLVTQRLHDLKASV